MRLIKFKGEPYILIGETDGAIATPEAYANGEVSFAHLFPNGIVKRYGKQIGTREDIEFGEETKVKVPDLFKAFMGLLGPSWTKGSDTE